MYISMNILCDRVVAKSAAQPRISPLRLGIGNTLIRKDHVRSAKRRQTTKKIPLLEILQNHGDASAYHVHVLLAIGSFVSESPSSFAVLSQYIKGSGKDLENFPFWYGSLMMAS